jgi:lycopene cyclase domain-containing protein
VTYLGLALVVVAVTAVPAVALALTRRVGRRWWTTTALLLVGLVVLTIVFDNLMIAVDLYRYTEDASVGLIGRAPVEDLAWPVVAAILLPALWRWTAPRRGAVGGNGVGHVGGEHR